jgi:large subunit ribosomal protein L17
MQEIRRVADQMVTLGKKGELHHRRQALSVVKDQTVVSKVFDVLAPRYQDRAGGYTRIIKLGNRAGDNAPMATIEYVQEPCVPRASRS